MEMIVGDPKEGFEDIIDQITHDALAKTPFLRNVQDKIGQMGTDYRD